MFNEREDYIWNLTMCMAMATLRRQRKFLLLIKIKIIKQNGRFDIKLLNL